MYEWEIIRARDDPVSFWSARELLFDSVAYLRIRDVEKTFGKKAMCGFVDFVLVHKFGCDFGDPCSIIILWGCEGLVVVVVCARRREVSDKVCGHPAVHFSGLFGEGLVLRRDVPLHQGLDEGPLDRSFGDKGFHLLVLQCARNHHSGGLEVGVFQPKPVELLLFSIQVARFVREERHVCFESESGIFEGREGKNEGGLLRGEDVGE